jgi:hypothetical protein
MRGIVTASEQKILFREYVELLSTISVDKPVDNSGDKPGQSPDPSGFLFD